MSGSLIDIFSGVFWRSPDVCVMVAWLMLFGLSIRTAHALRVAGSLTRVLPRTQLRDAVTPARLLPLSFRLGGTVRMLATPTDTPEIPTVDENGEPLSKNALKKLQKQAAIAAKKAAKAAEKRVAEGSDAGERESGAGGAPEVEVKEPPAPFSFSAPGVLMSDAAAALSTRVYTPIRALGDGDGPAEGEEVWVRGRLSALRGKGNTCFFVLREQGRFTVQACFFNDKNVPTQSKAMLTFLQGLTEESIVDVRAVLAAAEVKSCSQATVELKVIETHLISASLPNLPFEIDDAGRSDTDIEASESTERPFPRIGQELRLDNRWVDLRVPAQHAVMRVKSAVCTLFREALLQEGFIEIQTPKLIAGESEGGAGVFRTDYFGSPACLAQSPQLYKQMAISADFDRVFEIGPVFRAENSNTRRHLCEFVGLDLEMSFKQHYNEVIEVIHRMFVHVFNGLETTHAEQMAAVRAQYPSSIPRLTEKPCVIHWEEAMAMLAEAGEDAPGLDDLNTSQERALGALVAAKYGTDLYILDRFPTVVRPFYTMPCPDNADYSNSYDIFLRGEEICSGAQRVHDPDMLEASIQSKGLPLEPLSAYVDAMRHGMPPHGGGGIGLERLVFLYLGLDNVRKASMFPRDPNRCSP